MKIKESRGKSLYIGKLPVGCQLCIKGQKAVFFLGGTCTNPKHCRWYCPISEERRRPDSFYINEKRIESDQDVLKEIDAIDAKGISFTGGEPLGKSFDKVLYYLDLLKNKKKLDIHAHLYTTGIDATEEKLEKLGDAGLDEIRFHPPPGNYDAIGKAIHYIPDVGVEVPAIPTDENIEYIRNLIKFLEKIGGKFININEFEFSETNAKELKQKGFILKDGSLAAVEGSEESARKILEWGKQKGITKVSLHYCPIITKDEYQLKNRYKRRARKTRRSVEVITRDGTVLFGRINLDSEKELEKLQERMQVRLKISRKNIEVNNEKKELYFHPKLLKNKTFLNLIKEYKSGIVEAIPLTNRVECEYHPLRNFFK
ncbi:MAG: radical SAM protein [Candidatus Hodarchaeota archaeon]